MVDRQPNAGTGQQLYEMGVIKHWFVQPEAVGRNTDPSAHERPADGESRWCSVALAGITL